MNRNSSKTLEIVLEAVFFHFIAIVIWQMAQPTCRIPPKVRTYATAVSRCETFAKYLIDHAEELNLSQRMSSPDPVELHADRDFDDPYGGHLRAFVIRGRIFVCSSGPDRVINSPQTVNFYWVGSRKSANKDIFVMISRDKGGLSLIYPAELDGESPRHR